MSIVKERLLKILDSMPEYEDGEKLLVDLYKQYISLYGEDTETEQINTN